MKRVLIVLAIMFASVNAKADLGFVFLGGLSTPSDKVADIYNSNMKLTDISKNYIFESAKTGYNIGAKLRLPVGEQFMFTGGFMWNRFPQTDLKIMVPNTAGTGIDTILLGSNQNIIPISVGANLYLIRNVLGLYATGELSYNIIQNSVDYKYNGVSIPLNLDITNPLSPTNTRVGASIGAGVDFDLKVINLNLEGIYHFANLIGKVDNEPDKNYFTLTLGVVFGGK